MKKNFRINRIHKVCTMSILFQKRIKKKDFLVKFLEEKLNENQLELIENKKKISQLQLWMHSKNKQFKQLENKCQCLNQQTHNLNYQINRLNQNLAERQKADSQIFEITKILQDQKQVQQQFVQQKRDLLKMNSKLQKQIEIVAQKNQVIIEEFLFEKGLLNNAIQELKVENITLQERLLKVHQVLKNQLKCNMQAKAQTSVLQLRQRLQQSQIKLHQTKLQLQLTSKKLQQTLNLNISYKLQFKIQQQKQKYDKINQEQQEEQKKNSAYQRFKLKSKLQKYIIVLNRLKKDIKGSFQNCIQFLVCSKCSQQLKSAITLIPCGHSYCTECQLKQKCRKCFKKVQHHYLNKQLQEFLLFFYKIKEVKDQLQNEIDKNT